MRVSTISCDIAGGVKLPSLAFLLYALTQNLRQTLLIDHSVLSHRISCRLRIRTPVILYYLSSPPPPFFPLESVLVGLFSLKFISRLPDLAE